MSKSHPDPQKKSVQSFEQAALQDEQIQDIHARLLQEKEEPAEGFSFIPILVVFVFSAMCFWAGIYLLHYSGDFKSDVFTPDAGDVPTPVVVYDPMKRGKKVYTKQCMQCHQANGQGVMGVYPPLIDSHWVTGDEVRLAKILINGLNGPIEVNGQSYNGNMPAMGPSGLNLKAKDIAAVMTYIRRQWGNEATEVTIEAVKSYVDSYGARRTPWTVAELEK